MFGARPRLVSACVIPASIPSPSSNGFHVGPLFLHFYGLCYVVGITGSIIVARRLWRAKGGDPDLVYTVAMWGVPFGILGGRLYHDVTSWNEVPHNWWGWLAIWQGGLGIWGGIAGGVAGGLIPLRRHRVTSQLHGRGGTGHPRRAGGRACRQLLQPGAVRRPDETAWALQISTAHRPAGYPQYATFQPTFLYELIFDLALAGALIWLSATGGSARRAYSRCT